MIYKAKIYPIDTNNRNGKASEVYANHTVSI